MNFGVLLTFGDTATQRHPDRIFPVIRLLFPALFFTLLIFGGGLLLAVAQSTGWMPGQANPSPSLAPFAHVLGDPDFLKSLGLTFYIAATATCISAVTGLLAALFFAFAAKKSWWLRFVFQIPLTVPHLVIAIATLYMLAPAGLLSRWLTAAGLLSPGMRFPLLVNDPFAIGMILAYVWKEIPFFTMVILSVLEKQGREYLEAAATLGAGPWQRFRYVLFPVILPGMAAAGLIVFAYTFGSYEIPYLLGRTWPATLPVWAWRRFSDVDLLERPEGIATGLVIALVILLCVLFCGKLMTKGGKR